MTGFLINGVAAADLSPLDRGLCYGDGVFRTLKVSAGKPLWWDDQYAILARDCAALALRCPAQDLLRVELDALIAERADCVIKILLTRGIAGRGYRPPAQATPTRIVTASGLPDLSAHAVSARWCTLRLARQPRLAGIKHLNRLENVLARAEWDDPAIAEGLLCDDTGAVIGGTMTSFFALRDGRLYVPDLTQSGVAGATRERVLRAAAQRGIDVHIGRLDAAAIGEADEVFLGNSVVGLWRVATLADAHFANAGWTEQFRSWIDG
jgi:4-amino-4-deoxychorismate lyase